MQPGLHGNACLHICINGSEGFLIRYFLVWLLLKRGLFGVMLHESAGRKDLGYIPGENCEGECFMITGKSLRRMEWRSRRLMRINDRHVLWEEHYSSCLTGKTGDVRAEHPDDGIPDSGAEQTVIDKIRHQ
jgi:hypothetical protein